MNKFEQYLEAVRNVVEEDLISEGKLEYGKSGNIDKDIKELESALAHSSAGGPFLSKKLKSKYNQKISDLKSQLKYSSNMGADSIKAKIKKFEDKIKQLSESVMYEGMGGMKGPKVYIRALSHPKIGVSLARKLMRIANSDSERKMWESDFGVKFSSVPEMSKVITPSDVAWAKKNLEAVVAKNPDADFYDWLEDLPSDMFEPDTIEYLNDREKRMK